VVNVQSTVVAVTVNDTNTIGSVSILVGNTVNVLTAEGFTTNLVGSGPTSVNVGSNGSLQGIDSILNLENPPSFDTITVNDQNDNTARTVTLENTTSPVPGDTDSWGAIVGLAPAAINYEYPDTGKIVVNTGNAADAVNVLATGATTTVNGSFRETVNVGNAGSVQNIVGNLTIRNGGFSTVNINDSADTIGRTVSVNTVSGNNLTGPGAFEAISGLAPATIDPEYEDINTLSILGGRNDTFNVLGTGVTTNIVGGDNDTINVGNNGSVSGIFGGLNLENPTFFNTITVNDSNDTSTRTATISILGTNPSDSQGNSDPWGTLTGLAPSPINFEYADTSTVTVDLPNAFTLNSSGNEVGSSSNQDVPISVLDGQTLPETTRFPALTVTGIQRKTLSGAANSNLPPGPA
jgi:hypothetical protein